MRFLHTGDWHLGRTLHGLDLRDAQQRFIADIERVASEESVDCVLIAGDIFDRAVPPVESITLFTEALARLLEICNVIAIAGNHDSAIRLGFGAQLFRDELHIVTGISQAGEPVFVNRGTETVAVYPIPYLDPDQARTILSTDGEPIVRSHEAVMGAAMARVVADRLRRGALDDSACPAVVLAHAFVVGGSTSDSERDIAVGGVDSVNAQVFSGMDYVALGHLHGPQQVSSDSTGTHIRYAGSPIRYSFSESHHQKSVTLVDIAPDGHCAVRQVGIPQERGMAVLTGLLHEILTPGNIERHSQDWLRVVITDAARPEQLHERIRDSFPHAISILHEPVIEVTDIVRNLSEAALVNPIAVASQFVADVTNARPTEAELAVIRSAWESVSAGAGA